MIVGINFAGLATYMWQLEAWSTNKPLHLTFHSISRFPSSPRAAVGEKANRLLTFLVLEFLAWASRFPNDFTTGFARFPYPVLWFTQVETSHCASRRIRSNFSPFSSQSCCKYSPPKPHEGWRSSCSQCPADSFLLARSGSKPHCNLSRCTSPAPTLFACWFRSALGLPPLAAWRSYLGSIGSSRSCVPQ